LQDLDATTIRWSVRLPEANRAQIDPLKLDGYLLSTSHPVGRFKARFFAGLGYTAETWQQLDADLRAQHLTQDAELSESMPEGQLFTIQAILKGPRGQSAVVRSVWFVPAGGGALRFVRAYPGGRK
jgi:hypothetical protein